MRRRSFFSFLLGLPTAALAAWQKIPVGSGAANTWRKVCTAGGAAGTWQKLAPCGPLTLTIAANTSNYNMKVAAANAGWNQTDPLDLTVVINAGVTVGSTSTGAYAFDTGTGFPAGSTLALINNGTIRGCGGNGGVGAGVNSGGGYVAAAAGGVGGPAFIARYAIAVTNNGIIAGGGGGGGGGDTYYG